MVSSRNAVYMVSLTARQLQVETVLVVQLTIPILNSCNMVIIRVWEQIQSWNFKLSIYS